MRRIYIPALIALVAGCLLIQDMSRNSSEKPSIPEVPVEVKLVLELQRLNRNLEKLGTAKEPKPSTALPDVSNTDLGALAKMKDFSGIRMRGDSK